MVRDLQAMLRWVVEQVDAGVKAGLDLEALKEQVKVAVPPNGIYASASGGGRRALRIPAIESAFKEPNQWDVRSISTALH